MIFKKENLIVKPSGEELLTADSIIINPKNKIGLIGSNGSGKSSLIKAIEDEIDKSNLNKSKPVVYATIDQEIKRLDLSIKEYLKVTLQEDKRTLEEYEVDSLLNKVKLTNKEQLVKNLSGGELKRLQLVKALLTDVDLLILDEPTNHLDLLMIDWLEHYLKTRVKTFILISHDRTLLERTCNIFWEINYKKLYAYNDVNYQAYLILAEQNQVNMEAKQRKLNALYTKELKWIEQGPKARSTKSRQRQENFAKLESNLQSLSSQDEDLNYILKSSYTRLGNKVLEIKDLTIALDNQEIITNFNLNLQKYERIALVGVNGTGKTTIIKKLLENMENDNQEQITFGQTVKVGYLGQSDFLIDVNYTVQEYLESVANTINLGDESLSVTKALEYFNFPKNMHNQKVSTLSGGEKKRLHLIVVLMSKPNLLILDEPTNDLDLETVYLLEEYLDNFLGSIILITHDRILLEKISDRFIYLSNIDGSYLIENNLNLKLLERKKIEKEKKNLEKPKKIEKKKITYAQQLEFPKIEARITELETILDQLNSQMASLKEFEEIKKQTDEIVKTTKELDLLYKQYEEIVDLM